jgi:hypothetical protein
LLYGESLRRRRRRADARKYLRSAHETFEPLGATPWAEQAGTELQATGEAARKRDMSTADQLTPQELQIARFVAAGETNRGIATLLFLSPDRRLSPAEDLHEARTVLARRADPHVLDRSLGWLAQFRWLTAKVAAW